MNDDTSAVSEDLRRPESVRVALVVPLSGTLGMIGPGAANCAQLAVEELNQVRGLLGRPVELVPVDGGGEPAAVAATVAGLVRDGSVDGVVGAHASDVRVAVARAIGGTVPYVYTPPYEGGERTPGVFMAGETPDRQLRPALDWLVATHHAHRWFLVGNDYVWPHRLHAAARGYLKSTGAEAVGQRYAPFGRADPERLLDAVAAARADAVLLTLVGSDLVAFNRAVAGSPLAQRVPRLCAALEENGLLGAAGDDTGELYASMGYFAAVETDASLAFRERYAARFGAHAPIPGGHGEACYGGVLLLAAIAERAGTLAPAAMDAVADGTSVLSGRGPLTVAHRHVSQPVYLARADGLDFEVIRAF
jgi:ABC-type branched-subunit amino acid transport system substrate-binding protein